jgi:predicted nucleotidyltransferase
MSRGTVIKKSVHNRSGVEMFCAIRYTIVGERGMGAGVEGRMWNMNQKDRELVLEFKEKLPADLKAHLKHLIVFGSRATGEPSGDSDLDVVALVDEKTDEIERRLEDIAYQVMWDHDFNPIISLKVLKESRFYDALNKGYSFYRNIETKGVAVWPRRLKGLSKKRSMPL